MKKRYLSLSQIFSLACPWITESTEG